MSRFTSTHTIELEDHEVKETDSDAVWFCNVTAEVEVQSGTDHGDGGRTTYGSGPWMESEIDIDSVEATCVKIGNDGEELDTKTLEGDELIRRAEEAHH